MSVTSGGKRRGKGNTSQEFRVRSSCLPVLTDVPIPVLQAPTTHASGGWGCELASVVIQKPEDSIPDIFKGVSAQ